MRYLVQVNRLIRDTDRNGHRHTREIKVGAIATASKNEAETLATVLTGQRADNGERIEAHACVSFYATGKNTVIPCTQLEAYIEEYTSPPRPVAVAAE